MPVVCQVGSVGEQAAVATDPCERNSRIRLTALGDKVRQPIDRRYVVSGRRRYDRPAMQDGEFIRHDDKAASRLAPKVVDGRFDLCVAVNGRDDWHDLE